MRASINIVTGRLLQDAVGFLPEEIGRLVNLEHVFHYAREAAFLWTVRDRAARESHYTLSDLALLDARVEAHLEGLRVAGGAGWSACLSALDSAGPGEVFALAVLAFRGGDRARMTHALRAGCWSPDTLRGLVSALGWIDFTTAEPWIGKLLEAKAPDHRLVGIAAAAIHRRNPAPAIAAAVSDRDPVLRARALRAAAELKRADLAAALQRNLSADDESCRFWAAWGLALLGERAGVVQLTRWFERSGRFQKLAMQLALRAMPLAESRAWISTLSNRSELAGAAVGAVGIVGDPAAVPWLVRVMESPLLARAAGESFMLITGADITYLDLDGDPPENLGGEGVERETILDDESNLPWPSPERVAQWWRINRPSFREGARYLVGKPLTAATALDVLKTGRQRQRAAAAIELALLYRDQPLFEVRGRGDWQQKSLASWTP